MTECKTYLLLCDQLPDELTEFRIQITNVSAALVVWLKDKFGNLWKLSKTSNAEGIISILASEFPSRFFNPHMGLVKIWMEIDGVSYKVFSNGVNYEGILVGVAKIFNAPITTINLTQNSTVLVPVAGLGDDAFGFLVDDNNNAIN